MLTEFVAIRPNLGTLAMDKLITSDKTSNFPQALLSKSSSEQRIPKSPANNPENDLYSDRERSPVKTIARLTPHLASLGITRVARQTGLDAIGIPTFSAFRPNARTLAVSQGKGIDDDAAKASAIMEAVEFAFAERPEVPREVSSPKSLLDAQRPVFDAKRLLPMGTELSETEEVEWFKGFNCFTGAEVMVPADAVVIDATTRVQKIARTTNGLASGNTEKEALFHALCELIERDANTLFSMQGDQAPKLSQISPLAFEDAVVDDLAARIKTAGLQLALFNQTTNLGVPVIMATIAERGRNAIRHFDLAAGYGCHPISSRAAIRAITEAAQTRITNIAGARDDIDPSEYRLKLNPSFSKFTDDHPNRQMEPPQGCPMGTPLPELTRFIYNKLREHKIINVIAVPIGGERLGISVIKVFAPQLEDQAPNPNWRPGSRAAAALMGMI